MNNVAFFEIQTDEPTRAIAFYETVFGWDFVKEELLPIEYWQIETDGINGGLMRRPSVLLPGLAGNNAFVCSVQVEDFDYTAEKILDAGGIVVLEKFAVPGKCWQGYFIDSEGNTFGLFEVDESAV